MNIATIDTPHWRKFKKRTSNPKLSGSGLIEKGELMFLTGDKNYRLVQNYLKLLQKETKEKLKK